MLPDDNSPPPFSFDPLATPPTPRASNAVGPMLVGLLMLLIGIVIGYLSHPALVGYISPSPTPSPVPPTLTAAPSPVPTVDAAASATQAAYAAQLMDFVIANTRHFIGNPSAKVTLIEFSDFQ
jgi:hypothetical protein